jgi:hypothetical protein
MATWQYSVGHEWRYNGDDVPGGMSVRFQPNEEATTAGLCDCECGVCRPGHPHDVDDGCVCGLLVCPCLDAPAD